MSTEYFDINNDDYLKLTKCKNMRVGFAKEIIDKIISIYNENNNLEQISNKIELPKSIIKMILLNKEIIKCPYCKSTKVISGSQEKKDIFKCNGCKKIFNL